MHKDEIISDAVRIIRRYLPAREFDILLFGSWAKGDARETSDIDIGVAGPNPVDDLTFLRIKNEIQGIPTLRRIDIVDLGKADDVFRREVLSYARPL